MNKLPLKKQVLTLALLFAALAVTRVAEATEQKVGPQFIQEQSAKICGVKPPKTCITQSQVNDCRADFEFEYKGLLDKHCTPPQGVYEWTCSDSAMAKLDAFFEVFKGYAVYQKVFLTECEMVIEYKPQKDFFKLVCGNGVLAGAEECDDSNNQDGDGCSAQCKLEVPAEVDLSCYQEKHDGACKEQKDMCGNNQDTSQCAPDYLACLKTAQKDCVKKSNDPIAVDPKSDVPAVGAQDPLVKTPTNDGSFGQPAFALNGGACSLQISDSSPAVFPYAFVAMSIALALWNRRVKR